MAAAANPRQELRLAAEMFGLTVGADSACGVLGKVYVQLGYRILRDGRPQPEVTARGPRGRRTASMPATYEDLVELTVSGVA